MPDDKSAAVVGPLVLALFMVSGGLFVNAGSVPCAIATQNANLRLLLQLPLPRSSCCSAAS